MFKRNLTREVKIGNCFIGNGNPIAVQSMCTTKTTNVEATFQQILSLRKAGAAIIRIAADNKKDADALIQLRDKSDAILSVDLQENYRLAKIIAPYVDKIRYNPGHLYHHERKKSWKDKVQFIIESAEKFDCAIRIGVNAGSVDPNKLANDSIRRSIITSMVMSALEHSEWLDQIGFTRYCVSLKDSDPKKVILACQEFAAIRPDIPLHLGVTEAGMPPEGIEKTRIAFEQLIEKGIGDTIRVSLTLPNERKHEEITVGKQMLKEIHEGRRISNSINSNEKKLNLIVCPSCSRVENEAFIELAQKVRERAQFTKKYAISIAVMGCRVNGPGETNDADLGLWCGPNYVNLNRHGKKIGVFKYDEVLDRLDAELTALINKSNV